MDHHIPEKANRVLNFVVLALLLILVRVWYLAIIQHDEHLEKARRPKRKTVVEKVERATIRDRFNIPLALNKIQYNAAVCYADIRQIPAVKWETNAEGKRVRSPMRSDYIKNLSEWLAQELELDAQRVEDTIHSKAALFPHTPFILKEDLSEGEYYRLKLKEKDWVGIRAERGSKRYYPLGKIASDVIGYMGAISSKEYYAIAEELKSLQAYLSEREEGELSVLPKGFQNPLEVRERLKMLQEKAYSINDLVGKMGIEGAFDAELRGYAGKKTHEVDTKGNFLRELPGGREAVSGQRILLSISSELQEYAEQLLIDNEKIREARKENGEPDLRTPWIKGGAIVALDPKTGEILALASYPRIDPNDFIPSRIPELRAAKQAAVAQWLESETCVAEIWDGKRNLERERFNGALYTEALGLTWQRYLEIILSSHSSAFSALQKIPSLHTALTLQEDLEKLLEYSGDERMNALIDAIYSEDFHLSSRTAQDPEIKKQIRRNLEKNFDRALSIKQKVDLILEPIKSNNDKLLVIDLCRLLADKQRFPPELLEVTKLFSPSEYRALNQSYSLIKSYLFTEAKCWFHERDFQSWRKSSFKDFLKQKRQEEKEKKYYARPYTDYLERIERQMFNDFWEKSKNFFIQAFIFGDACPDSPIAHYQEAISQLRKNHPKISLHAEKMRTALEALSGPNQQQFLQTMRSYEELTQPLYGRYRALRTSEGIPLEKHLAAAFYPLAGYGYGRSQAFRQTTPQGSVFKMVIAYQSLVERYENLKKMQQNFSEINPLTLIDNLQWHPKSGSLEQVLGYTLDGKMIKRLYKGGKLPRSSHPNIGKIDIVSAIEQSSNIYFSILAADHVEDPLNLIHASKLFGFGEKTGIELPGEIAGSLPDDLSHNLTGLYAFAIGQHTLVATPLQTAVMFGALAEGAVLKPKIVKIIAGKEPLREYRNPFESIRYPFQESLSSIGIHFPLFSSLQTDNEHSYVWSNSPEVKRVLFMPDPVRDPLMEGMHLVLCGPKGTARPNIIRALGKNPQWMRDFQELKTQLIGKTGTAEILYKQTLDSESQAVIKNHIWFGGVVFSPDDAQKWEDPELAIAVYLRFSEAGGKEATPLAVEIAKKWREIRQKHGCSSYIQ